MAQRRRPKLGQHFLTDSRHRQRMVEALDLRPGELVVEIGAGQGAMSELLSERAKRVVAIEIDVALVRKLKERFRSNPGIEIFQGDILSTDLTALCRRCGFEKCCVFGNLPYYITSPIIRHLFSFTTCIRTMALLVQREVGERLTAKPGTRAFGFLSVLAQFYSSPRLVLSVPPGAFSPPPTVYSALVDFGPVANRESPLRFEEHENFMEFVKRCFAQKRKNLRNNLAGILSRGEIEHELASHGLRRTIRAEQLTVEQFVALYRAFRSVSRKTQPRAPTLEGEG